jgi:hypothetical protein
VCRGSGKPLALFGDADGHGFVFLRIERLNHRRCRNQRNLVFSGTSAEQYANAQTLFFCGHNFT